MEEAKEEERRAAELKGSKGRAGHRITEERSALGYFGKQSQWGLLTNRIQDARREWL